LQTIKIIIIWMLLVTGLFFLVLLLNQRWSPPLRLQASHCSTFRIMCDVPSIVVFSCESIECFPGIVSKFFLKLLVTTPVAPIITGIIEYFRFHIRFIYAHKLLYFNFPSASFRTTLLLLLLPPVVRKWVESDIWSVNFKLIMLNAACDQLRRDLFSLQYFWKRGRMTK